jgi:hypothetical protein
MVIMKLHNGDEIHNSDYVILRKKKDMVYSKSNVDSSPFDWHKKNPDVEFIGKVMYVNTIKSSVVGIKVIYPKIGKNYSHTWNYYKGEIKEVIKFKDLPIEVKILMI